VKVLCVELKTGSLEKLQSLLPDAVETKNKNNFPDLLSKKPGRNFYLPKKIL